jgi:hypothetical protein
MQRVEALVQTAFAEWLVFDAGAMTFMRQMPAS